MKNITTLLLVALIALATSMQAQTELLVNPNFTSLSSGWLTTGDFNYNTTYLQYNFDIGYAYNTNLDNASGYLYQQVSIPASTSTATYSFYYKISTDETTTSTAFDICTVRIIDVVSYSYTDFRILSNLDKSSSYLYASYAIPSSYFGRTVQIQYILDNDGAKPTVFRFDNVSLMATTTSGGGSGSCTPVAISSHPINQNVSEGASATFSVSASGTAPISYQWYKNGLAITGANSSSYTTPTAVMADNGNYYYCNVSNCSGLNTDYSNYATITVNSVCSPVGIGLQPSNQTAVEGNTATFSMLANGTAPYTYQWYKNGTLISGATNASYTTPILSIADNGSTYYCMLTNCAGSYMVYTGNAYLTVNVSTTGGGSTLTDLSMESVLLSNSSALSSSAIDITCSLKNLTTVSCGGFYVSFHLSTDNVYGGSDIYLGEQYFSSMASLYTSVFTKSITLPSTISNGSYYILASADGTWSISEVTKSNNTNYAAINIVSGIGANTFSLNPTLAHLYWPFPYSNWNIRNGWNGGSESISFPGSGHGEDGHKDGDYYADDWNNINFSDCNQNFYAPISGTVIYQYSSCSRNCGASSASSCGNGYGNTVVIKSDIDASYAFKVAHLNGVNISIGDHISQGDLLGIIGSTGNSTGSHAHCVLYKNIQGACLGTTCEDRLRLGLSCGLSNLSPSVFACNYKFDAYTSDFGGGLLSITSPSYDVGKVYPNPCDNEFIIELETETMPEHVYLMNIVGQEIDLKPIVTYSDQKLRVNSTSLINGIYTVYLMYNNRIVASKLIVQH